MKSSLEARRCSLGRRKNSIQLLARRYEGQSGMTPALISRAINWQEPRTHYYVQIRALARFFRPLRSRQWFLSAASEHTVAAAWSPHLREQKCCTRRGTLSARKVLLRRWKFVARLRLWLDKVRAKMLPEKSSFDKPYITVLFSDAGRHVTKLFSLFFCFFQFFGLFLFFFKFFFIFLFCFFFVSFRWMFL